MQQRRPLQRASCSGGSCASPRPTYGDASNGSPGLEKERRHGICRASWGFIWRRRLDMISIGLLLLLKVIGYIFVTRELLQPEDARFVRFISAIGHVVFVLFLASWAGIIFHGPGRVPEDWQATSKIPDPVVSALAAGCWSSRPYDGRPTWCCQCNRWKPPLVHHCSTCGQCSVWMDHHCNLAGQCVGLRNFRCFIVWLFYMQLLLLLLGFLALRRLTVEPLDRWVCLRLLAFSLLWVWSMCIAGGTTMEMLERLSHGWHSKVLLKKCLDVIDQVDLVRRCVDAQPRRWKQASESLQALHHARVRVTWDGYFLRGLLLTPGGLIGALQQVFGEAPSPLWMVPFRPGGVAGLWQSPVYDAEVCAGWAALAALHADFKEPANFLADLRSQDTKAALMVGRAIKVAEHAR